MHKKALIITNHYLESYSGGSIGSRSTINIISEIFSECYVIYPDSGKSIDEYIDKKVIKIPCRDKLPRWAKGIMVYFGRLHRFYSVAKKLIKSEKFDLIIFDTCIVSRNLISLSRKYTGNIITLHHGSEIDYYKDNKPPLLIRIPFMIYLGITERKALLMSNLNIVPTIADKNRILFRYKGRIKESNIEVFSVYENKNSKIFDNKTFTRLNKNKEIKFIITGSLRFTQSEVGIKVFFKDYLPIIKEVTKSFKIIIAGSNPGNSIVNLCKRYSEVELISNPADISKILINSDIYICPVSLGSGIKLRIMDGLKFGLPVLAHKESVSGYEQFKEAGYLYEYNSPLSFRSALKYLINNRPNPYEIACFYKEKFSFETGVNEMKNILYNHFGL